MSKENYQCGSCEQFFAAPDKEGECPHCGSGNWFKGTIDEPEPEELVTVYDLEGFPMTMTKAKAEEYNLSMTNCFKQLSQALANRPDGYKGHVIVWGTTGEIDGKHNFKDLWYQSKHFSAVKNIWADTNKRSLSDLIVRADELEDDGIYKYYLTPDATHKNWIKGSECKLYKKYEEDMKKEESKNWFGEQLNLWDSDEDGIFPANMGLWLKRQKEMAMQKYQDFSLESKISLLNQVSEYLMHKHPGSEIKYMEALPGNGESGFHITSDTQAISIAVSEELMEILIPELGVKHTFIHRKKEENNGTE